MSRQFSASRPFFRRQNLHPGAVPFFADEVLESRHRLGFLWVEEESQIDGVVENQGNRQLFRFGVQLPVVANIDEMTAYGHTRIRAWTVNKNVHDCFPRDE